MNGFENFLEDLKAAPAYVKENAMCYFYHNTSACRNCPKIETCPRKEPQPMPLEIPEQINPGELRLYMVPVTAYSCLAVPNPKTEWPAFEEMIRKLAYGEYAATIKKRKEGENVRYIY